MVHGGMTEAEIEDAALDYFRALGYRTLTGPESAPDAAHPQRSGYDQVLLTGRLREAAARINPDLPAAVVEQVIDQLQRAESQNALAENQRIHQLLTDGVPVEHRGADGATRTSLVWLVDWDQPEANDWLVARQFTVLEQHKTRRPDLVVFLNGLPLGLLELKSSGSEQATMKGAWNQIQTYRTDIPSLFTANAVTVLLWLPMHFARPSGRATCCAPGWCQSWKRGSALGRPPTTRSSSID